MDPLWIAALVNPAVTAVVVSALTQHFIGRRTTERIKRLESDLTTARFDHEQASQGGGDRLVCEGVNTVSAERRAFTK